MHLLNELILACTNLDKSVIIKTRPMVNTGQGPPMSTLYNMRLELRESGHGIR